ncbi:MAG: FAD-binding oxidoreductase [Candidatus Levyibacteriota bacterium]
MDSQKSYQRKKQRIIQQFRTIKKAKDGSGFGLAKQGSNLFRTRSQTKKARLDVRDLNQVISIDKKHLTADVEGMTMYEDLVRETLKHHLLPTVVPELATITIGGAVSGGGIEASSFRYGLVHETIEEMDILLSTGELVTARRDNKYRDLFAGVVNTFGTLGYVLRVRVKLIPAAPYVKLRHYRFSEPKVYFETIEKVAKSKTYEKEAVAFMDGMVLGSHELYLTLANFTDTAPYTSDYTYLRQFYQSIPRRTEDYLTVRDFIWRWDTDWFWCSKRFGLHNPLLRLIIGKWVLNSKAYWKMVRMDRQHKLMDKIQYFTGAKKEEAVIQDVQVPLQHAVKFLDFFSKKIGIKPVWICPTAMYNKKVTYPFYTLDPKQIYINFGFWDFVPAKANDPTYHNRMVEHEVNDLGGRKGLYSDAFYTEEEFWKLYPKNLYTELKKKYDPEKMFKDIYQKCILSE